MCNQIAADKPLDLFLMGFNDGNILMVTSKETGYLVYQEPVSSWNYTTHQCNLTSEPTPMKYKWPNLVNSDLFKVLEAKDKKSPSGKVFPFTAVNSEGKNFLVLYNKGDAAMYDFKESKMIQIKSTENRWSVGAEGFFSSTDKKSSYEISLGYNGSTDKMMINRSFAFISNNDAVEDIFSGDQTTFHICQPSSGTLEYEKDNSCNRSVDWAPMKAFKFTFAENLKFFYLFGPKEIFYYQEDYDNAVPYYTKTVKDFFICPSVYFTTTLNPNRTGPDGGNSSAHNGGSEGLTVNISSYLLRKFLIFTDSKISFIIIGILLFVFLVIVLCMLLYCFCLADKDKKKEKKKKKTATKKTKTKKKTAKADKTVSDKKSDTKSDTWDQSDTPKVKVKKNAFAGKVGLLAKKTGKLGKESHETINGSSNVTLRSGMVAGKKMSGKKKKQLVNSKQGSTISDGAPSRITLRSLTSGQKGKSKGKMSKLSKAKSSRRTVKGGSSNVSSLGNMSSALSKSDGKVTSCPSRKESDLSAVKLNALLAAKGKMSTKSKKVPPK